MNINEETDNTDEQEPIAESAIPANEEPLDVDPPKTSTFGVRSTW